MIPVRDNAALTIASLFAILLSSLHLADDIARGFEKGGVGTLIGVLIFAIWLYGTLGLAGRRSGYIIILVGSVLALAAPVVHMSGRGIGSQVAHSDGGFFFAWTLIAIGMSAFGSAMLAAHGLWSARSAELPRSTI
ncbi:MAG: hypothetical protein ACRENC_17080 [Gemmatimonadaceae bacterium]